MTGARRYVLHFADGKSATVLDMLAEPPEVVVPGLLAMFRDGYVVRIEQ
ncbi:hypothetical protein [Pseudomonas nitroreducens]|nr:hypothetical protein [Pseudomonas nitroreducens]MCP1652696.1 hypothetical protein [Pseudomonas nitroreducens]